jgi:hypothetical protein
LIGLPILNGLNIDAEVIRPHATVVSDCPIPGKRR